MAWQYFFHKITPITKQPIFAYTMWSQCSR